MPSVKKDYIRASASIPSGHYRLLEKLAEKNKVSVSWVIRDAIEKYLGARTSGESLTEVKETRNEFK